MADNGLSKKVCIAALCIDKIAFLGVDAENKIPYIVCILIVCVIYKTARTISDLRKGANNGKNEES